MQVNVIDARVRHTRRFHSSVLKSFSFVLLRPFLSFVYVSLFLNLFHSVPHVAYILYIPFIPFSLSDSHLRFDRACMRLLNVR